MANSEKTNPETQAEITEAGAVELEEGRLDEASGGLIHKLGTVSPTGLKINSTLDRKGSFDAAFDADSLSAKF